MLSQVSFNSTGTGHNQPLTEVSVSLCLGWSPHISVWEHVQASKFNVLY